MYLLLYYIYVDISVRVHGGYQGDKTTYGIVEIFQKYFWTPLCVDMFDQADADVVCKPLGYLTARVLLPGQLGRSLNHLYTVSINCTGNETDILYCEHDMGLCSWNNFASVLCSQQNTNPDKQPGSIS